MARWLCSGDGPALHVECSFTTDSQEEAFSHFEATSHAVDDELERADSAGQAATHTRCGGLAVSGFCFDCGTDVPASEQIPLASC